MKTPPIYPVSLQVLPKTRTLSLMVKVAAILFCTFSFLAAKAQLSGLYTIDPSKSASSTNYKDFHSAVTDLDSGKRYDGGSANGSGVSGPVVFKVADGTYNENVHLFTIPGTSTTNTVLFESASSDSSKVIISSPAASVSSINGVFIDFTLFFEDVAHITFSEMTIQRPGNVVLIESGDSITIKNCKIITNPNSNQPGCDININMDLKSVESNNIFILNNHILYGDPAINIQGNGVNGFADNIVLGGNILDSFMNGVSDGIKVSSVNHLAIKQNYISPSFFRGISCQAVDTLQITSNVIHGDVSSTQGGSDLIANNEIFGFFGTNDNVSNVYFNTFYTNSTVGISSSPSVNFFNNLIVDTVTTLIGESIHSKSDYNDYIYNHNNYFGEYNSSSYTSLKTWQTGTGLDLHSLELNPDFVSTTNLAPQNMALNFGTPIAGITTDINGNPRDPNYPTVGALNVANIKDTTLCKNSCAIFTAPMSGIKYLWSTGDSTKSIKYCPSSSGTVWVSIKYGTAATDTLHIQFTVNVTSSTCVWPGDANYDGKVDMNDFLSIGVAYNDTGAKRPNATDGWYAQSCNDWSKSFTNGINHKNADCDGNGIADSADMSVISLNYSKSHLKNSSSATGNSNDPPLSIIFSKDSAMAGDTVQAIVNLGSKAIPASSVYGLAFSISYAGNAPAKYYNSDFSNSWLGTYNKNMVALVVNSPSNQSVDVGVTRTDHINNSGYGEVGKVSIVMPDNLAGKREVKTFINFNITAYKAINSSEGNISLYPTGDSILVYEYKSGINPDILSQSDVQIYPNPANDVLHIKTTNNAVKGVIVTDLLGRTIFSTINQESPEINLPISSLPKGIYILNISTSKGNIRTRFIKE